MDYSFLIIMLLAFAALWFMSSRSRKQQREAADFRNNLAVGDEVSLPSFAWFAWKLGRAMGGSGLSCTVPIANLSVQWDRERAVKYFGHLKNGTTDDLGGLCTKDGMPK